MVFEKRILILEDDLRAVQKILERLGKLEDRNKMSFWRPKADEQARGFATRIF